MKTLTTILFSFIYMSTFAQVREEVIIVSSKEQLASQLQLVKNPERVDRLYIWVKQNDRDYKVYPVVGHQINYASQKNIIREPIARLPKEVLRFSNIKHLDVSSLGLKVVDPIILEFAQLTSLNISYNNIDVQKEVSKLQSLPNLQTLIAFGCSISDFALLNLRDKQHPIRVLYRVSESIQYHDEYYGWKKSFQKINPTKKLKLDLLQRVHKFFPIGMPNYLDKFPGQEEYDEIAKKWTVDFTQDFDNSKGQIFSQELKGLRPEWDISNHSSFVFPGDRIKIKLTTSETDNIKELKTLCLIQSVFTKHYTIFIDSRISLKKYKDYGRTISQKFFSGEQNTNEEEKEMIVFLKEQMKIHYPSYTFVNHKLLMETMITGGIPRGGDFEYPKPQYAIYDFLFGNELSNGDYKILE